MIKWVIATSIFISFFQVSVGAQGLIVNLPGTPTPSPTPAAGSTPTIPVQQPGYKQPQPQVPSNPPYPNLPSQQTPTNPPYPAPASPGIAPPPAQ